ncbi:hypothetical protein D1007_28274 [Hordeum vulgare]|nr:hypothetical protein D1007_28274 [Hordeum vulgare]KAI4985283.1 hypothetical protein ZWY2020_017913 [Hordeum vulgare]
MARLVAAFATLLVVLVVAAAITPAHSGRPLVSGRNVQPIDVPFSTVEPPSSSKPAGVAAGLHRHFDISMVEQPADGPAAAYYYGIDCDYKVPITGQ